MTTRSMPPPEFRGTSGVHPGGDDWADVRVVHLEISREADRPAPRARAEVYLGSLLPADVTVHATLETAGDERRDRAARAIQLWSVQSHNNGSFVYESRVPPASLESARAVTIEVRPSANRAPTETVEPATRTFPAPGSRARERSQERGDWAPAHAEDEGARRAEC